jgi:hypothetical protein
MAHDICEGHLDGNTAGAVQLAQSSLRWTPRHKLWIVVAVRDGALSAKEACLRYRLSSEELAAWVESFERHGFAGLHAKRLRRRPPQ